MRATLTVSVLVIAVLLVATAAAIDETGWCHWLPWKCETHRTPFSWGKETVECRMRRTRYCCNSEPPAPAAHCPGSDTSSRRNRGWEQWVGSRRGMECPSNPDINLRIYHVSQKVNTCSTAHPQPHRAYPTVWCPWEYWTSWQSSGLNVKGECGNQYRTRNRRCSCAGNLWLSWPLASCLGSKASVEKQERSNKNCSIAIDCDQQPRVIVDRYYRSPVPIVLVCLASLVALVVVIVISIICCAKCKRKRASTGAAPQLSASFRRAVGILGFPVVEPTAPAYGSPAFYDAGSPVPTVSLKVSGTAGGADSAPEDQQAPPPPYTSQPVLPRDSPAAGEVGSSPSGMSQQHQQRQPPPPPYFPPVEP